MILLYHIQNRITGQSYIGQTCKTLQERWAQHKRAGSGAAYLHRAIACYGADAFVVTPLCYAGSRDKANELERYLIRRWGTLSPAGYNLCEGGNVSDSRHPDSTERMREKLLHRKLSPESISKRTATRRLLYPAAAKRPKMTNQERAERTRQIRLAEWRDPVIRAKKLVQLAEARERRKAT